MPMNEEDIEPFLVALVNMAELFSDEMTKMRQKLYWQLFRDACTLEEWQAAVLMAMQGETFHKVPLPNVLYGYIKDYRRARYEARKIVEAERQAREDQKLLEHPPLSQVEMQEQLRSLFAQLGDAGMWPAPRREERIPEYRQPLDDRDVADRKARLKAQAEQIARDEETRRHSDDEWPHEQKG